MHFNPFQHLDAGSDPYLHRYLMDYEAFPLLWEEQPVFLFAPPGGGKSAFRVRLAAACRAEDEGRRFFPIPFLLPSPEVLGTPPDEAAYFTFLSRSAAGELLFHLAYRAYRFLRWERPLQRELKTILMENLPVPLEYYLGQLEEAGNLSPLAEAFDPTARDLPIEPLPETLRSFCQIMRYRRRKRRPLPLPQERFESLVQVLLERLHFEAVFLLVDGADAYVTRPEAVLLLLEPLLRRTGEWAERRIFIKYFLPTEMQGLIEKEFPRLAASVPQVTIKWTTERLAQVMEERLRVASRGMFTSFRGMGTVGLPVDPEAYLAAHVSPLLPREVIYLAGLVLDEHLRRAGPSGRIELTDLDRAIARYRKEKGLNGASTPS
ncbi:MAG: hypothetical protein ACP5OO_03755 [Chloroflexia bacterium]